MEDDLPAAKSLIEKQSEEDEEAVVNRGCLLYKEGLYSEAIEMFNQAVNLGGSKAPLRYWSNSSLFYNHILRVINSNKKF